MEKSTEDLAYYSKQNVKFGDEIAKLQRQCKLIRAMGEKRILSARNKGLKGNRSGY